VQGLHLGEPGLGPRLVLAVAGGAGLGEIRQFARQARQGGLEVVGQEHLEGVVSPAVDRDPGHEALLLGREGEVNGPLLVALQVVVGKEPGSQVLVQGGLGGDPRAVGGPGVVQGRAGGVGQAVSAAGVEGASSNKQYSMRQRRGGRLVQQRILLGSVAFGQNIGAALAFGHRSGGGAEAAQGHAQCKGQVVQRSRLRVQRFPGRQGRARRAVHGLLRPSLSPGPAGGAGLLELDRGLAVGLVLGEGLLQAGHDHVCRLDGEEGETVDVADFEVHAGVQGFHDLLSKRGVHQADRLGRVLGEDRGAHVAEDAAEAVQAGGETGADHREGDAGAEVVGLVRYLPV